MKLTRASWFLLAALTVLAALGTWLAQRTEHRAEEQLEPPAAQEDDAGPAGRLEQPPSDQALAQAQPAPAREPAAAEPPTARKSEPSPSRTKQARGHETRVISGTVLLADGRPARDARVLLTSAERKVDEHGWFQFNAPELVDEHAPLAAIAPGQRAVVISEFGSRLSDPASQTENLRIVLEGPPLTISGRVLDENGQPCSLWHVALQDATYMHAGVVLFGRKRTPAGLSMLDPESVEALSAGSEVTWLTYHDGTFSIGGLLDREYRVQAWSGAALAMLVSDPVRAGERNLILRIPADAHVRVFGRVVGHDGHGLAGVQVNASISVYKSEDGQARSTVGRGDSVKTADDGSFELVNAAREHGCLNVDGDAIEHAYIDYADKDLTRPIVIDVPQMCEFRVMDTPTGTGATKIQMRDSHDHGLTIWHRELIGKGKSGSEEESIGHGVTRLLTVTDDAKAIVFTDREGKEVARRPVSLVPGQVTDVRW